MSRWPAQWPGRAWDDIVLYELHVGAFTPESAFASAARKLDHLVELGVTAVEIMPVADFRGRLGWGYDGIYPYAPRLDLRAARPSSRRPTGAASRFCSTSSTIISDRRGITFRLSHPTSSPTAIGRLGAKRSISRGRRAPRPRLRHRERGILDRRVSPGRT